MILVTGGAGFIGSRIVRRLAKGGRSVAVSDYAQSLHISKNLDRSIVSHWVEPTDLPNWIATHGRSIQSVIHMGAISSTVATDITRLVETNIGLSRRLWDWCARSGVPMVYASSAATYGDGSLGFDDRKTRKQLWCMQPLNAYARSKHLFDLWASSRAADSAPPFWAGLKFFNVYGPGEAHKGEMRSVVSQFYDAVSAGGPAKLFRSYRPEYPDGGQLRDFVHVSDCADVVDWLLYTRPGSGLYNVGSGMPRSFLDVANIVFREIGKPTNIRFVDMPSDVRRHYQYRTCAKLDKLQAAGCPVQFRSIEMGIADYLHVLSGRTDANQAYLA